MVAVAIVGWFFVRKRIKGNLINALSKTRNALDSRTNNMQIHITYTGGTIGMVPTPNGLAPGAATPRFADRIIAGTQLASGQVSFTQLDPLIDSSNATPDNWQAIIDDLRANRDRADAFIVLHGTDTMAYTAAALSYALTDFGKPVILTGSQLPLGHESDATANVAR